MVISMYSLINGRGNIGEALNLLLYRTLNAKLLDYTQPNALYFGGQELNSKQEHI